MGRAELNFLLPLFDLAASLTDDDSENPTMGLGEIDPDSDLARDDRDLDGYWVSSLVKSSVTAAVDHVATLGMLVNRDSAVITASAPWTLLRAAVEAAGVGLWVAESSHRKTRRARALRVWHYDYSERSKWERDIGFKPTGKEKSSADRAHEVLKLAAGLDIKPATQVSTDIAYVDCVATAAAGIGWERAQAQARWREAAAFAHGRFWPQLSLTTPQGAARIPGGYGVQLALSEEHFEPIAALAHDLLNGVILRFSDLAQPAH